MVTISCRSKFFPRRVDPLATALICGEANRKSQKMILFVKQREKYGSVPLNHSERPNQCDLEVFATLLRATHLGKSYFSFKSEKASPAREANTICQSCLPVENGSQTMKVMLVIFAVFI